MERSTGDKTTRRKIDFSKFVEQHKEQMEAARTRKTYVAGVALAVSKKTAKSKLTVGARNPKGTLKELMRCAYYHPLYCTVLGHTSAASK